jgi:hypothetical protein
MIWRPCCEVCGITDRAELGSCTLDGEPALFFCRPHYYEHVRDAHVNQIPTAPVPVRAEPQGEQVPWVGPLYVEPYTEDGVEYWHLYDQRRLCLADSGHEHLVRAMARVLNG